MQIKRLFWTISNILFRNVIVTSDRTKRYKEYKKLSLIINTNIEKKKQI